MKLPFSGEIFLYVQNKKIMYTPYVFFLRFMGFFSTLRDMHTASTAQKVPNVSMKNGYTLMMLTKIAGAKNVLEVGTANGISTLFFAKAVGEEGHVTTIEKNAKDMEWAKEHANTVGMMERISFVHGDAKEVLDGLHQAFDLIFIDAMKREYVEYFQKSLKLAHEETLFIFDDVVKFREKMDALFTYIEENNFMHVVLPTDDDDGILLVLAKDAEDGRVCWE